jgi:Transposase DDE domain
VYGDKAYDDRNNFNILDKINAEPAVKIRKNASVRSKGCPLRRDEVLLIRKLGYDGWKDLKDAGRRWIVEIVFSAIKRVFGEDSYQRSLVHRKLRLV